MVEHAARGVPGPMPVDDDDDEATFLAGYDIHAYPRPSVAVDVSVLTVADRSLHAVLVRRRRLPQRGRWALPGGFVRPGESPEDTVSRVLRAKVGLAGVYTAQLETFGSPHRDPRGWIVSVAHIALVPLERVRHLTADGGDSALARLRVANATDDGPQATAVGPDGDLSLAFDHGTILGRAVERVRGRLWYTADALELMPAEFTLLELLETYEALLGRPIDKNSFRRRILASGLITAVGRRREGLRARPAELFRVEHVRDHA